MEKYSGTSDLEANVKVYDPGSGILEGKDMDVNCRLFPTTLVGVALEWYYSLPKISVDSFGTFCGRFLARFTYCKLVASTLASLHNVVQGEIEGLRQFMTWFARATLNIPDLHPTSPCMPYWWGYVQRNSWTPYMRNPPKDMDQLRARATRYISIEENMDAWTRAMKALTSVAFPGIKRKRLGKLKTTTP